MNKLIDFVLSRIVGFRRCTECDEWCRPSIIFGNICSQKCLSDSMNLQKKLDKINNSKPAGYVHDVIITDRKCPKCKSEMIHDEFCKMIDYKTKHIKGTYECISCGEKRLFNFTTKRLSKKSW